MVICQLLGVPFADHGFFQRCSRALLSGSTDDSTHRETQGELLAYLDRLIGEKLAVPDGGLLSRLAAERVRTGELSRRELAVLGLTLLGAGHGTTASMIALGTLTLLRHPGQLAVLRDSDDPRAAAMTVEELLRYVTISPAAAVSQRRTSRSPGRLSARGRR
jgi:cytochrome P450